MSPIVLYLLIFILKTIEVSLSVVRIIIITKGEKVIGSIIAFFEVLLWIFLIGTVLIGIQDDPIKAVVYAAGFAVGQYIGSLIENKLALGTIRVEAIVIRENEKALVGFLRSNGYAVTTIKAQGMLNPKSLLLFYVQRNRLKQLTKDIKSQEVDVVITVEDIKPIYGGYRRLRKK